MISTKLTFYGMCREAIEFYKDVFHGEIISIKTFKEKQEVFPNGLEAQYENLIFSSEIRILQGSDSCSISMGDSPVITFTGMDSFGACKDNVAFDITLSDGKTIKTIYDRFMENGGKSNIPLGETNEYTLFGSMIDKFGVCWTLYCVK